MTSFFADTPVGRLINQVSKGRFLKKPDQEYGFKDTLPNQLSSQFLSKCLTSSKSTTTDTGSLGLQINPDSKEKTSRESTDEESSPESSNGENLDLSRILTRILVDEDGEEFINRAESRSRAPAIPYVCCKENKDIIIVDWYHPKDPEDPANWSQNRKILVTVSICMLTFSVYAGSAIVTPGIVGMTEEFGVSLTQGTLSLSVFIMGYAVVSLISVTHVEKLINTMTSPGTALSRTTF
jgi:DHA1 family multidrug resistance protein-like MFS transporter